MDLNTYFQTYSQSELARALGITPGMVWQWKTQLRRIPAERVLQIERATGGKVTRHELRPDLYPLDSNASGVGVLAGPLPPIAEPASHEVA